MLEQIEDRLDTIHRLRRKLEGSGLAIRTVRGLGYLLEAEAEA